MFNTTPGIVIVTRETRLAGLKSRWMTAEQAKFRLVQAHAHEAERRRQARRSQAKIAEQAPEVTALAEFDQYVDEDQTYQNTLRQLRQELELGPPVKVIDRAFVSQFDFRHSAVVVVIGPDGLVANTAKYAAGLPIVAVNPDPARFDGVLLPFEVSEARAAVQRALHGQARTRSVTLAEVQLNDGQRMLAFNDFFIGCASHVSARYTLEANGQSEPQSSSGVLVSTGAGSTGWLSSVFNMTRGVARFVGGTADETLQLPWEDRRLMWVVREPFVSRHSQANLVAGLLDEGQELVIESVMPEQGVIFSDGIESDFLSFTSGTIARVKAAEQTAELVV